MPSRRSIIWFFVALAPFLFANLPHDGGPLKSFLVWAGFPWEFAFWQSGQLESFSIVALVADICLALTCASVVAYLCSLNIFRSAMRAESANEEVMQPALEPRSGAMK